MSGTIVCAANLSPTQQQLKDFPRIVLTYPHDWDPHSVLFPKGSHSEEEEYLFTCIAEIRVDALRRKVHDTEMETGIRNTVHEPSFITMRLVSQVRIDDAKVSDATRITDIEKEVFEGWRQDILSHRNFTSKERHLDVSQSDLRKIFQIGLGANTKTLKSTTQRMLRLATMPISRRYMTDRMFERPQIKGKIFTDTMVGRYK